ncbi:MAG: glycine cleavage system protein GcvH [Sulfolobales archaeon]
MVKVDEFELKEELYYWRKGHTWVKVEGPDRVRVGLDDVGVKAAGQIVFVRLKPKGAKVKQGEALGVLESAKWVGPIESPVSGEVVEVNDQLRKQAKLLMSNPYDDGWVAVIKPSNLDADLANLIKGSDPAAVDWYKKEIDEKVRKKK